MSDDVRIADSVRAHGWHAMAVEGAGASPPFVYTIGLCQTLRHPELILFGLSPRSGHGVLSKAVDAIRRGRTYQPHERIGDLIADYAMEALPVHPTQLVRGMGYALAYYRRAGKPSALSALELLWPDRSGILPDDPRCESAVAQAQPRLDGAVPPEELSAFMAKYGSISN